MRSFSFGQLLFQAFGCADWPQRVQLQLEDTGRFEASEALHATFAAAWPHRQKSAVHRPLCMHLPAIGLPICVLASEAFSFCVDALALKGRAGAEAMGSCLSFKLRLLVPAPVPR